MSIFKNQIFDNRQKEFSIKPFGTFQPGGGLIPSWQESITGLEPEENPPNVPPPTRELPKLMTTPPKMGMSSYPDVESYRSVLKEQPKREEHQLNKKGKWLAFGAGLAEGYNRGVQPGIETGLGLMDRPYNQAMEDWKSRVGGKGELANLEVKLDEIGRKKTDDAYKMMYDYNKNIIDWEEAKSRLELNDAQIRNYESLAQDREQTPLNIGGRQYILHKYPGHKMILEDLGVGETAQEKRDADWEIRNKELGVQLDNALKLEKERHAGDIDIAGMRASSDESLLRLRYDLERAMMNSGIDLDNFKKAWDIAVTRAFDVDPGLTSQIMNPDGSPKVDRSGNVLRPELWDRYKKQIQKQVEDLLGWTPKGSSTPRSGWPARNTPITPSNRSPQSSNQNNRQNESAITAQALEAIRMEYPNQPQLQSDSIALKRYKDAIRKNPNFLNELKADREKANQTGNPSIAAPPVATPPVQLPQNNQGPIFNQVPTPSPLAPQSPITFQGAPISPRQGIFGPRDVPIGFGNSSIPFPLTGLERRSQLRR